jgi:hypothetical protein
MLQRLVSAGEAAIGARRQPARSMLLMQSTHKGARMSKLGKLLPLVILLGLLLPAKAEAQFGVGVYGGMGIVAGSYRDYVDNGFSGGLGLARTWASSRTVALTRRSCTTMRRST